MKKLLAVMILSLFLCGNAEAKRFNPPILTAEFDQMAFMQLYPTFSWEPLPKSEFYEVRVVKMSTKKIVRELFNSEGFNRVTDWEPFTETGEYYWQVRVVDKKHKPLSDWSEKKYFEVTAPVAFAALGDSITHGGASYIPAGQISCQWETFCDIPIKNLGRSGDTTEMMINRFEKDVLPFKPRVLIIMGGINDVREGKKAAEVIKNLENLRGKCLEHEIIPVFCTITPMNPEKIKQRGIFITDGEWQEQREKINFWIKQTPYFIDVAAELTDELGYLRADLTPDGLHPALRGKKLMGEKISAYLRGLFIN